MEPGSVRLAWNDEVNPRPIVHGSGSVDLLVELVESDRTQWAGSPALEFDGADDVKLAPEPLRRYLATCRAADDGGRSIGLASALVAEGSLDNRRVAKPTDLHFTAGQQQFLRMAGELRNRVTGDDIRAALEEAWTYPSTLPSLGWDTTDDRVYALSASNPATTTKLTMPGAEWLALMGISAFPVSRGADRTRTPGCAGTWKRGSFTWPLWRSPLTFAAARTLLSADPGVDLARCSAALTLRCAIRRSDQGGYGSFSPPQVVWERA
jgi:hypothetical protein